MLVDELGGLIGQLPGGLIAITCSAGILWAGLMVYFAFIRPARKRRREAEQHAANPLPAYYAGPIGTTTPAFTPSASVDLPDLDLLMDRPEADFAVASAATSVSTTGAARRLGSSDVKLSDGITVHANEELLILRDPRDGRLIVQTDAVGYKSLRDAPDAREVLKRIFAELGQQQGDLPRTSPQPAAPRPSAPPITPPPRSGMMPGDLPKFNEIKDEIKSRGAFRPHKTETPAIPDLNISGAIETYLQYKKSYTPEYAQRSIHVLPAPGGGVRIEVDGKYYEAIDDVKDLEVRAFLQATIQEWQSRQ